MQQMFPLEIQIISWFCVLYELFTVWNNSPEPEKKSEPVQNSPWKIFSEHSYLEIAYVFCSCGWIFFNIQKVIYVIKKQGLIFINDFWFYF